METKIVKNFEVLSIDIKCDYKQAFDYIADAENLPKWTNQFKDVSGSRASFDTFNGIVDITFETHAWSCPQKTGHAQV
ncbi:hypothetical protein C3L21_35595 (plasmid) [Sinorhizobium meliloti]|nr:hypothetical protein C3L21_35595 [Sinorhizobium meliloti]